MRHAPHLWWGDCLDSRFLAVGMVKHLRARRVLDIGCNAGVMLSELDPTNFRIGLDRSREALRLAQQLNPAVPLMQGDMMELPFRDGSFDAVIYCGMLEVAPVDRRRDALREVARVLRPGGEVYLTALNRGYWRYRSMPSRITYTELESLMKEWFEGDIHGFNPIPPFPWGLPNAVLAQVPGIWRLLQMLMVRGVGRRRSCSFLVRAVKRPSAHGR